MTLMLVCPICDGCGSYGTIEGPQQCYGCNGSARVNRAKFVELLAKDVAPAERLHCIERALEVLERA